MKNTIYLQDFLSDKTILHSKTSNNFNDAITFSVKNKDVDIITYTYTKHFLLFGIDVLGIDSDGRCFYEYTPERIGDIIDNIHIENSNIQLSYYINGIKFTPEEVNEFVFVSAQYSEFKIRITFFEKPKPNDEFKVFSRYYIINNKHRKTLTENNVIAKNILYLEGFIKVFS